MVQAIGDPDKGKIYIGLFDLTPVDGILPLANIASTCDSTFQLLAASVLADTVDLLPGL